MKKVLIIEDDSQIQKLYKAALEEELFEVTICGSGVEALQVAKNDPVDIVLLDIMLGGGMNGFDVLEQLKRNQKTTSIPVIVLTNIDSEKKTALAIGANDYIVKTETSLAQVVQKIKSLVSD